MRTPTLSISRDIAKHLLAVVLERDAAHEDVAVIVGVEAVVFCGEAAVVEAEGLIGGEGEEVCWEGGAVGVCGGEGDCGGEVRDGG